MLLFPPGLDFIAAFFGCLYAGIVAVPAYPPRTSRTLWRLDGIVEDSEPRVVLTTQAIVSKVGRWVEKNPLAQGMACWAVDTLDSSMADSWVDPSLGLDDLAFLQYTSGSTGTPKGVRVTHGNLLHNEEMIRRAFDLTNDSRIVGWLPLYHDMGLIGNVIQPLYLGASCVLMSPLAFLQKPVRWLEAISRYRATTSGGPNFAYDLCARRVGEDVKQDLDLSTWTVAFNGAEPVRAETLDRFAQAFASCGFRREALYPCYGLAEATLLVAGEPTHKEPEIWEVEPAALERGSLERAQGAGRSLVSSGQAWLDQEILVVDPDSHDELPAGKVGEIWVRGPSVARGYWNRPELSRETFAAHSADGRGPFLRTGDLGSLWQDRLFVTGRIKDLIIVRGRNHYPQDLERSVERAHEALRPGCGAAFSIEREAQEALVVVQEVHRRQEDRLDAVAVAERIREALGEEHEIHAHDVVLIRHGTLPKTSSGKIRRSACRQMYLADELEMVGRSTAGQDVVVPIQRLDQASLRALDSVDRLPLLLEYLRGRVAALLGRPSEVVPTDQSLLSFGLDSLRITELEQALRADLGLALSLSELLEAPDLETVAEELLAALETVTPSDRPGLEAGAGGSVLGDHPVSYGQRALWFLERLAPDSGAYNIVALAEVSPQGSTEAKLNVEAFERSLNRLVRRHPQLRATLSTSGGELSQTVHRRLAADVRRVDVAGLDAAELMERLGEIAYRPFDLEGGPLVRVRLLERGASKSPWVLFAIHHLVTDFWSLGRMLEELGRLYGEETGGSPAHLPSLPLAYTDWVEWQRRLLEGEAGDRLWSFWQDELGGDLADLDLPTDRPRPKSMSFRGGDRRLRLSPASTSDIEALGRRRGATLFMTLLAIFQTLLGRYAGQRDFAIGSPSTGRTEPELETVAGYFVNPLVLRTKLAGNPTFEELLDRVRHATLAAYEHRDFPFALLTERLHPVRDPSRTPLFQVMLSLQRAPAGADAGLAALALGEEGETVEADALRWTPRRFEARRAQFDLTLLAADLSGELALTLQYNRDLFDGVTMDRFLKHFRRLLQAAAETPDLPLSRLPMLSGAERDQLVRGFNDSARDVPERSRAIHREIAARAGEAPEAPALAFEAEELSRGELDRRANRLARYLIARGLIPGQIVGVHMTRSVDLVVTLLAVWKAGGTYLPLDSTYPADRLAYMLEDSGAALAVTQGDVSPALESFDGLQLDLDAERGAVDETTTEAPDVRVPPEAPAYVIYTSGSTGQPKGVVVPHAAVLNFFAAMDDRVGCGPEDTLLAGTSISFDISVLELFWTLARGARVVLLSESALTEGEATPAASARPPEWSLFYFSSNESEAKPGRNQYRLLLEGARFADREGFAAVWTPERHFHAFGGKFPNPAVTGAAVAAVTERLHVRAGSVVLPLHDPIRVAEQWSVVDNLTDGRVGIAFASGWHADDFVFFPERYEDRKKIMEEQIETVRRLWRGESVTAIGGSGDEVQVRILPRPVQNELPVWITTAGSPETFERAGALGAHVLTHLLGQSLDEVAEKIRRYRAARAEHGHHPDTGKVSLMLHTFVGEDLEAVRETVRGPFTEYLRSSVGLIRNLVRSLNLPLDFEAMSEQDMDDLLAFAFDRYFDTSALFGDEDTCLAMIEKVAAIGVDDVACLIDFGVDEEQVLTSLPRLARLRDRVEAALAPALPQAAVAASSGSASLAAQAERHPPTLFQATPSTLRLVRSLHPELSPLENLRALLLGGEELSPELARFVRATLPETRLVNVYGPTETTIWSTSHEIEEIDGPISIGRPVANTETYVLDAELEPVPVGVPGALWIGGLGVTAGYLGRSALTAERFRPDPFARRFGGRIYETGDLARHRPDGTLEFLGRADRQVKLRGFRIELGEIEAALDEHEGLSQVAVLLRRDAGDDRLVGYAVRAGGEDSDELTDELTGEALRAHLRERLPEYMVPSAFVFLEGLPRAPGGKLDRRALPAPEEVRPNLTAAFVAPRNKLERDIAEIWCEVLGVEQVGVNDNFFDLGGHSLLMAQAHGRLKERLDLEIPLVKLLELPTVKALALHLSQEKADRSFSAERSRDRAERQRQGRRQRRRVVARLDG